MRALLPSVWLLGAALYTALILVLSQPALEAWPLPPRINETVVAKQPARSARLVFNDEARVAWAASAAEIRFQPKGRWRNEWVQIAGYTTVGRVQPSAAAPVLFAYSVGRPLRVLARQNGFVRVQDLGSGQLGWVREASVAPFTGGYRLPEPRQAEPLVAAVEPEAARPEAAAVVTPVAVKKAVQPRPPAITGKLREETVAATEPAPRGLFRKRRNQVQRVALDHQGSGVAAIMQRALSRF